MSVKRTFEESAVAALLGVQSSIDSQCVKERDYSICQHDVECLKRIRDGVSEIDAVIALRWKFPDMGYSESFAFIKSLWMK